MVMENITWDDMYKFVDQVEAYYKGYNKKPLGVYGLPRGGLVLAVMVSHRLDVPLLMAPAKDCLIVDDVCDSGDSLLHYDKMGYDIAVMACRSDSPVKPMLSYEQLTCDWIVFPYETNSEADARRYYEAKEGIS